MEKICNDCKKKFKYQEQDIITEKYGIPCIIIKCPKCNTFNVLDIDFPSGINKKVVGVMKPKKINSEGQSKNRRDRRMKEKILKVIELIAKWGTVMLITSLLQLILTDKQLIGLVLFIVLLIDDRTFSTHDLLKDKAVTIDKIHVITKQLYLDAECNTKKIRGMDEKLSNIENKASEPMQMKKFTLED